MLASQIQLPERYRVTRHIASGGMASVWEVEDLLLERVVAVKVLGAQYAADGGARERFQREARTAARVCDHPHIATIYDIGEHAEDAFIVMELFSGGTVADRLRAAKAAGRRVPRETALRWLREAAAALDHAHGADIVHRDVKPANLLLDAQDRLAVGDFGIARLADDTHMTQTGQLLGTAAYVSPEQALGGAATAASDRYAFAVVAYELLTGARPFAGGPPSAQVRQHAEAQPQRASEAAADLPAAIDAVFARGLAKEPHERPLTAAALVDEIERALDCVEATERTQPIRPVVPLVPNPAPTAPPQRSEPAPAPRAPAAPPAAPPPRKPATAAPPPGPAPPARRTVSPLVPIGAAAAIAGTVLAIAFAGSGDGERAASSTSPAPQAARERTQSTAAPEPAAQSTSEKPATAPPPASSSQNPAALNDRGYALSQAGNHTAALPLLRASVEGYREAGRTSEIGYAYALFNYGVALAATGDPASAVAVFQERLKFPDQRGKVLQELRAAQAQLGGDTGKKPKKDDDD